MIFAIISFLLGIAAHRIYVAIISDTNDRDASIRARLAQRSDALNPSRDEHAEHLWIGGEFGRLNLDHRSAK